MKILNTTLVLGCMSFALSIPSVAFSQTTPEVVDSYPKQILKERAEKRAAEREAARAASMVNTPAPVGPVTAGSSPMGIDMVVVNPGAGKLGSPDFEKKRARFENPLRDTYIGYQFEVSKYEITFDDWNKCVSDGGCSGHKPDDKGWGRGKRPVINVSFNDAKNFLTWLNGKTGQTYRLLSEAEWESVARNMLILMAKRRTVPVLKDLTCARPSLLVNMNPMPLVSMTCMAMSMNGSKIAGILTIAVPSLMARLARMAIANFAS